MTRPHPRPSRRSRGLAPGPCAFACVFALTGCPPTPTPPAPTPAPSPVPSPSAPAASSAPPARAAEAKAVAEALGKRLLERLQQALSSEGVAGGVRACSAEAQALTAAVGRERGAAVGRTSWKLRNPRNAPPAWARAWVDERADAPRFQESPDGALRALLPIRLQGLCLQCHGPADQLSPDVRAALQERYPDDQATGFQPGDLRGWFWVELPPAR